MRIASYNIRKSVGLDWKRDPDRILKVLREISADIVLLQEVDKRVGSRQGTLPSPVDPDGIQYDFVDIAERPLSVGWHGNAILYGPSVELLSFERVPLPSFEPRGAVSALFQTKGSKPFRVIGAHLGLQTTMRAKQAAALTDYMASMPSGTPCVLAGDFNEWRLHGAACQVFEKQFDVLTPGPSFHTARPKLPLDRFVVSREVVSSECRVFTSDTTRKASDHLPIYLDTDSL
ncbi:endonuclease/exonuclease/phosphatase family protein [Falsihalocynthiibacter sp. S25ZX9]|jgi:endonuclease/exonuclease/phosphatase family metal-dependent hydrolase|uniref:endonuclease/exonuclease/phosphatase family protein n=1 Tax=Falsihalocynthiibacter sp. S25ZX9 TaxID=3240870 RepID=UPI0035103132